MGGEWEENGRRMVRERKFGWSWVVDSDGFDALPVCQGDLNDFFF
jgi:hypothetical protein